MYVMFTDNSSQASELHIEEMDSVPSKGDIVQLRDGVLRQVVEHRLLARLEQRRDRLDSGGQMLLTLAGAMSTAELGIILARMVRQGKVRNIVTYPAVVIGLVGHALTGGVGPGGDPDLGLLGSLSGFAVGFLPLLVAWLAGGIGGGDAKLMGAVGALTGWRFAVAAMFYGFAVAGIMAIVIMLKRRITKETFGRILRWLYLAFTPARPADPATAESPTIPFGLALCIGSAIALADVLRHTAMAQRLWIGV